MFGVSAFRQRRRCFPGGEERSGGQLDLRGADFLREFRMEDGLPVWIYHVRDHDSKSGSYVASAEHGACQLLDRAGSSRPRLELRPAFHFRHHETQVNKERQGLQDYVDRDRYEIGANMANSAGANENRRCQSEISPIAPKHSPSFVSDRAKPGLHVQGDLWSPGFFHVDLGKTDATFVASTEEWDIIEVLSPSSHGAERERRARLLTERPRKRGTFPGRISFRRGSVRDHSGRPRWRRRRGRTPPATKYARSSPDITGSPTGAATR